MVERCFCSCAEGSSTAPSCSSVPESTKPIDFKSSSRGVVMPSGPGV